MLSKQQIEHKDESEAVWIELHDIKSVRLLPPKVGKFDKLPTEIQFKVSTFLPGNDFFSLFGSARDLFRNRPNALKRYVAPTDVLKKLSSEYWSSEELRKNVWKIFQEVVKINNKFGAEGKTPPFTIASHLMSVMDQWVKSPEDNDQAEMGIKIANQLIEIKKVLGSLLIVFPSVAQHHTMNMNASFCENYRADLLTLRGMIDGVWEDIKKIDKYLGIFSTTKKITSPITTQSSDKEQQDDANDATFSPSV
jgi:hypothetical protein